MTTVPNETAISARATMIARGLLVTKRATGVITEDHGKLCLKCRLGGYYWISLDGCRVWRGKLFSSSDELQPTFTDAMERAGRTYSHLTGLIFALCCVASINDRRVNAPDT